MNKVILAGRLTKDVEVQFGNATFARFIFAVDRRVKKDDDSQNADFISCVAFGNRAEFLDKYGRKGTKLILEGRIQTGRYVNDDGVTVYTTDVVVESLEFAESKKSVMDEIPYDEDGFMQIPDGIDEELPFR